MPATVLPAAFFIAWDSWFVDTGIWSFNPAFITGTYIFNLPVEEVLFFFIIPYCGLFVYECMLHYYSRKQDSWVARFILQALSILLLLVAFFFSGRLYTGVTFCFTALFFNFFLYFRKFFNSTKLSVFLISYGIIIFPFLIVNGLLTALPVVLYNSNENMGIRIYSIPVEDLIYGMLLIFMNVVLYDLIKTNNE